MKRSLPVSSFLLPFFMRLSLSLCRCEFFYIYMCTYVDVNLHVWLYNIWSIDFLASPTPLIILHRLPAFLESLMPLKNWCSIHARLSKSILKHSIRFWGIFSKFKTQFYCSFIVLVRCPHVQIAFLKFTSCDNQVLVGCIPIAAVAVILIMKS